MEQMASDFGDRVRFLFIYIHEAHPGELIPHHTSYEQKVQHARMIRDFGVGRHILIDDLGGGVHHQYGELPNMSWIIDHTGRIAYKAAWTDANDIRMALEEVVALRERKGLDAAPFFREFTGIRMTRPEGPGFLGGEKAYEDMRKAFGSMSDDE